MKKTIGWFIVFALLAVSFSLVGCATPAEKKPASAPAPEKAAAPTAAHKKTQLLFIIERSKNANVVHYEARLTTDGKLDPKEPVVAYWVLLAENGRREELSWIEKKKAYGFTIKPDPSVKGYKMNLVAAPERQITVKEEKDAVRAEAVIDGRPAVLEKMYINASDGLTGPKVHYIEVYGKDLQTGEKRREKMVPK
jgi:predicted small lipoprotein YifL